MRQEPPGRTCTARVHPRGAQGGGRRNAKAGGESSNANTDANATAVCNLVPAILPSFLASAVLRLGKQWKAAYLSVWIVEVSGGSEVRHFWVQECTNKLIMVIKAMQCGGEPRSVHGLLPQIRALLLPQAFAIESALEEQDTPLLRHPGPVLVYRGGAASPAFGGARE